MKNWTFIITVITILLLFGCDDNPTHSDGTIWLELTADTLSGTAPLTVNFTGTLHGSISKLRLRCEEPVLCPGYGKTYSAKRNYETQAIYNNSGQFRAYMVMQAVDGRIFSDTLVISVQEQGSVLN